MKLDDLVDKKVEETPIVFGVSHFAEGGGALKFKYFRNISEY